MSTAPVVEKRVFATVTATAGIEGDSHRIKISAINPDRDGDRVFPSGCDYKNYLKNPVVLWAHNDRDLPVATASHIDIVGDEIFADIKFLPGDAFAARVENAYKRGFVRAQSIRFSIKESKPNSFGGLDIKRWELLEISFVCIPAHQDAVKSLLYDDDPVVMVLRDDDDTDRRKAMSDDETYLVDLDDLRKELERVIQEAEIREAIREAMDRLVGPIVKRVIDEARGRIPDASDWNAPRERRR
jgi:hypothetical protein